jgi:hypothetical protein
MPGERSGWFGWPGRIRRDVDYTVLGLLFAGLAQAWGYLQATTGQLTLAGRGLCLLMVKRLFSSADWRSFNITTAVAAVLLVAALTCWYASFFKGAWLSYTLNSRTTLSFRVCQVGSFVISKEPPVATHPRPGFHFQLGDPCLTSFGFPGLAFESSRGPYPFTNLQLPFWFLALVSAVLPSIWVVNRYRTHRWEPILQGVG